jgi:hypothetical protein
MDVMLLDKFGDVGRGKGAAHQKRAVRNLAEQINQYLNAQSASDQDGLFALQSGSPEDGAKAWELLEDPDNPRWFDADSSGVLLPENENLPWSAVSGLWLPAAYAVEVEGASTIPAFVSVTLSDEMGTLRTGRDRLVNDLDSRFGLDVTDVTPSDEWRGRFNILRAVGGRSIVGLRYRIPALPATATLKSPHVHEVPSN